MQYSPSKAWYALIFAFLLGCSSGTNEKYPAGSVAPSPSSSSTVKANIQGASDLPWVIWSDGKDLNGGDFNIAAVLKGDEYLKVRDWVRALKEYTSIRPNGLKPEQKLSLVLRIASAELQLNQPAGALRTVSDYYKSQNLGIEQVDLASALIFAYAYGATKDYDQSMAWFVRARTIAGSQHASSDYTERGVKMLLGSLSSERFEAVSKTWHEDTYVNAQAGRERARRARMGNVDFSSPSQQRFWELPSQSESISTAKDGAAVLSAASSSSLKIGVVVPLSGKYGAFGQSLKNGVELALKAQKSSGDTLPYSISYKDSGVDLDTARQAALDLIGTEKVNFILGPLLSENSVAVADLARDNRVPLISFSKSSSFDTGSGIFRLGPTPESQVDSLIDECFYRLGLRKFALVYPNDVGAAELVDLFKNKLRALGVGFEYEATYSKDDSNALLTIAQELDQKPTIEAIFFPDGLNAASKFSADLSPRLRERTKLLGTASWDNLQDLSRFRASLSGAIFVSPFFSLSDREITKSFVESYKKTYNKAPDFLAAQGFDAATLVLAALKRGATEQVSTLDAFTGIEKYQGLTGDIQVEAGGELKRRFSIVQLSGENLISPPDVAQPAGPTDGDRQIITGIGEGALKFSNGN